MTINELFLKDYIILDGGMGTMLQAKGMETGTIPETLNILKPDWIIDVKYIRREPLQDGGDRLLCG